MSLKKGLCLFLLFSIAVSGAILYSSVDKSALSIFVEADFRYLAAAALAVVLVWVIDAWKLVALTVAAGESLTFGLAIRLTWINYFGAALTPMQSGGGPFQMYLMYKNGISVGKTVAITLVRTFLSIMILGLAVPFVLLFHEDLPEMGWGMKGYLLYVGVFITAAVLFFGLSLTKPRILKRFFGRIIFVIKRLGLFKSLTMFNMVRRTYREVDAYRSNIRAFMTTGRRPFCAAIVLGVMQMAAYLSVMPLMMISIGTDVSIVQCCLIQALFIFSLYFMPTPGGSGAAEGGAALVASLFVPWNVAGMLGVGWRVLTEYTGIVLGAIVALRLIGWALANEIASKGEDEVEKAASA